MPDHPPMTPPTPLVSPEDLRLWIDRPELLLVDCRHDLFHPDAGREAWAANALPGARFLHLDTDLSGPIIPGKTGRHPLPAPTDFARTMARLGLTEDGYVVAYDDKGGGIAARLWWMLRALGHERVAVLDGGIQAWTAAGFGLRPGEPAAAANERPVYLPAPASFPGTRDRAQVNTLRQDPGFTLVDSRTATRYRGEEEPIDPIAGHIDGAINLPWPDNLSKGKFRPKDELKIRFAALRDEADHTVFYCGSGVTACHNILAYHHALGGMPGLYPGSWSEWITELES